MRAEQGQPGHCFGCEAPIDPMRSRARIIGGRIVSLCAQCAGVVQPAGLRPGDTGDTSSEWLGQLQAHPAPAPSPRPRPMWGWTAVAVVILAAGAYHVNQRRQSRGFTTLTKPALDPRLVPGATYRRVVEKGAWASLDMVPTPGAGQWIHPLASATHLTPDAASRVFGASRPGSRPAECRRGHCGVDLMGPRGTLVVAVASGTVTRVQRGTGSRSGKYVRVVHEDGSGTSYMHLDEVAPDLERGMFVEAGQLLGTLGRTGIKNSSPHLHFSLDVPRGEHRRYIDPYRYLEQAQVIEVIDVRYPLLVETPKRAIAKRADEPSPHLEDELDDLATSAEP